MKRYMLAAVIGLMAMPGVASAQMMGGGMMQGNVTPTETSAPARDEARDAGLRDDDPGHGDGG